MNILGIKPNKPRNGFIGRLAQWFSNPNSAGNFNISLNGSLKSKSSQEIKTIILLIQESMNLRINDQMIHLRNKKDLTKYEGHRDFIIALLSALKTAVTKRHQKKKSKQKFQDTIDTIIQQNISNRAAERDNRAAADADADADAEQDSDNISELIDLLDKLSLE